MIRTWEVEAEIAEIKRELEAEHRRWGETGPGYPEEEAASARWVSELQARLAALEATLALPDEIRQYEVPMPMGEVKVVSVNMQTFNMTEKTKGWNDPTKWTWEPVDNEKVKDYIGSAIWTGKAVRIK